jgi:16S rRNA (cytosine967-C5)-methyltransferase
MNAREAAYAALSSYRRNGAWSELALDSVITKAGLDHREASLATRICMGVLQNMMLLDWHIERVSAIPFSRIQPQLIDILRIGSYQILFTERIPIHAAVDESVKLARRYCGSGASGFVNALLRRLSSERTELPVYGDPDPVKELSIRYSHPEWLVKEYISSYGMQSAEQILSADNTIPSVSLQVNTLKSDTASVLESLSEEGIRAEQHGKMKDCVVLESAGRIAETKAYRAGSIYVQDCAARASVEAAGPADGMTLIDACAAPGGKSFAAAVMMGNRGRILAFDIHEKKLGRIRSGAERLGISIIETSVCDARRFESVMESAADIVLTDVPCSGTGVIRKKPEIRYKEENRLASLPDIQLDILRNQSRYVKPGGALLYSTCTLLRRENEEVITRFLDSDPGFQPEDFNTCFGSSDGGMLTLMPSVHGTDGFFICKLRRTQ